MTDIIDRFEVEQWSGDGRAEVQASRNSNRGRYEVRICGYQPNGRFAQYPPHITPDKEHIDRLHEGIDKMAKRAQEANRMEELEDINELVDEVGREEARTLLEDAANRGTEAD